MARGVDDRNSTLLVDSRKLPESPRSTQEFDAMFDLLIVIQPHPMPRVTPSHSIVDTKENEEEEDTDLLSEIP